jgi:N,N'-diacetyllegionaminate synthase|tara:strand:+ start:1596 stop:2432 length:837 start_codon:yes stop_codon:yes gene_type:complete
MKRTKIIAEIASSHNGDIKLAKALVRATAQAGADIVKFQSWQAKNVSDSDPDKARYGRLELSDAAHKIIAEECKKAGIEFLTTCFDRERIPFLKNLGLKKIKVPSTALKEAKLLEALVQNFDHIFISIGMSTVDEIKKAMKILSKTNYTIMHCISIYPTPLEKASLAKINWLKRHAKSVGYSDHTMGTEAPIIAMSMGIDYLEKHFTLSRHLPQETHTTSEEAVPITTHTIACEPRELKEICDWSRKIERIMGDEHLDMYSEEKTTRKKYTGRLGENK